MADEPGFPERQPLRDERRLIQNNVVADALIDADERERIGLPRAEDVPLPVVVELNLAHVGGLSEADRTFRSEWEAVVDGRAPVRIADIYYRGLISVQQVRELVQADLAHPDPAERAIYRIWPDFPVQALIDRSGTTVKADAAGRAYDAMGRGITWAVVDSGIDAGHPHFARGTLDGDVRGLHRDFTKDEPDVEGALVDEFGHGTHVAGIIAGGLAEDAPYLIGEHEYDPANPREGRLRLRTLDSPALLRGMAPLTKLVSLKVLDAEGRGSSMNIVRALEYVRRELNGQSKLMRVQGVNLSVGYEFDAAWFACGQSPLCVEVDRLVRSGVVVVVAAGNTGYGALTSLQRQTKVGLTMTINDPGNARLAITVGATHRYMPHTYGVSYFSSKGPTGDGRPKPDLVAPGERITSCAAGRNERRMLASGQTVPDGCGIYIEDSGTSMAAPHVSGAIAGFLSIRQEFIGQPEEVKRIFCSAATSLDREPYFQGHGL
ncbi:MAG TPA: S8 family peptidase, partial [Micromonosporaceae bacterium]|nr:S8 family peptidase [Micromonosporaceae bacterium]